MKSNLYGQDAFEELIRNPAAIVDIATLGKLADFSKEELFAAVRLFSNSVDLFCLEVLAQSDFRTQDPNLQNLLALNKAVKTVFSAALEKGGAHDKAVGI